MAGTYKEKVRMGFLSGITSFVKEHSEVIHGVLDIAGFIPGGRCSSRPCKCRALCCGR